MATAQSKPRKSKNQPTATQVLRDGVINSGLKLTILAARAGIQYDRFLRIVNGKSEPTLEEALSIQSAIRQSLPESLPLSMAS